VGAVHNPDWTSHVNCGAIALCPPVGSTGNPVDHNRAHGWRATDQSTALITMSQAALFPPHDHLADLVAGLRRRTHRGRTAYIVALSVTMPTSAVRARCIRSFGPQTIFRKSPAGRSLKRGLSYRIIRRPTLALISPNPVDGETVRARFDLATKPSFAGRRVVAHIDETFVIPASTA